MSERLDRWLTSVGAGWRPLITKLDEDLAGIAPDYEIFQVKEKFGGLRYYIGGVSPDVYDEVHHLIGLAEEQSFRICERCGQPGRERSGGWILTLCDACDAS